MEICRNYTSEGVLKIFIILKSRRCEIDGFYAYLITKSECFYICIIHIYPSKTGADLCFQVYYFIYIYIYIQGVPGGMCQTSGECSLC